MTSTFEHANPIPKEIARMIRSGFSMMTAYRRHARLPIQYVASRTGLPVRRVSQIEAGANASTDEITAIHKAVGIPSESALGLIVQSQKMTAAALQTPEKVTCALRA